LFIGEKSIIFKKIFNFLKKVLKYPEKTADRGFFGGFSKNGSRIWGRSRWVFFGVAGENGSSLSGKLPIWVFFGGDQYNKE